MNNADLQVIVDHHAISNLLIDYCRCLDRMDLPRLAALFTHDCRVEYGPDDRLNSHGAAALESSLRRMWRWARTSHHLSNVRVSFDDADHARANSYVHAWHERPDGSSATILGQYDDRLVRLADGWRISRRRMVMNGCDAGFKVAIHPFERIPPPPGWAAPNID
jgi:3-phenylpropionate/cinnamic acid dioxygenase small subunit